MPFALALVLLSTRDAMKEIRDAMPSLSRAHAVIRKVGPGKERMRLELSTSSDSGLLTAYKPDGSPTFYMSFDDREVRMIDFATAETDVLKMKKADLTVAYVPARAGQIELRLLLTGASFAVGEGVQFVNDSVRRGIKIYEFRRVATDEKLTVEFPVATRSPFTIRDHGQSGYRVTFEWRALRPTDALAIPEDLWRAYHRG